MVWLIKSVASKPDRSESRVMILSLTIFLSKSSTKGCNWVSVMML